MKGRSTAVFEYVLDFDKENNPEVDWTIFHLKPILPGQASKQFGAMISSIVEKGGVKEIKEGKFNKATFDSFCGVIEKIEGWEFSKEGDGSQLPESQKTAINELAKEGRIDIDGDESAKLRLVFIQLTGADRQELLDAADEQTIETLGVLKKKSKSGAGSKSSDTITR